MCGRITLKTSRRELEEVFGVELPPIEARYNIAPSQDILSIRNGSLGRREGAYLRWGLIPSWAKEPSIGNRLINARAESVFEKPAFRAAVRRRRCLIPADGFYEWIKSGSYKQPVYIHMPDGKPFAIAALWETWQAPRADGGNSSGGEGQTQPIGWVESCTFLTTQSNERFAEVHHRMPVILRPEHWELWLDPEASEQTQLEPLFQPDYAPHMIWHPVSTKVNSPYNEGNELIEHQPPVPQSLSFDFG